jgi:hypothetical protein
VNYNETHTAKRTPSESRQPIFKENHNSVPLSLAGLVLFDFYEVGWEVENVNAFLQDNMILRQKNASSSIEFSDGNNYDSG